jgi:hypothetical protein
VITKPRDGEIDPFFSWKVDMFQTLAVNAALARAVGTASHRQGPPTA